MGYAKKVRSLLPSLQITTLAIALNSSLIVAQDRNDEIRISFDITSLTAMITEPEKILNTEEEFWKNDRAYQLSANWHKQTQYPLDMGTWRNDISSLSNLSLEERQNLQFYKTAMQMYAKKDLFHKEAVPHIQSFLPISGHSIFETTVYMTAYTTAYAFMNNNQMVLDLASSYWDNNSDFLLNELTHELFHVGYGNNIKYCQEDPLESDRFYEMIISLHNEGLATYVGYSIQDVFPAHSIKDYVMMDNPHIVKKKIAQTNNVFSQADTLEADKLSQLSWDVGVMDRAYYVTGGHMARTIDRKLGRAALINTITTGPRDFIDTYNRLVPEEEQILHLDAPDPDSSLMRLQAAALANDDSAVEKMQITMVKEFFGNETTLGANLSRLGFHILNGHSNPDAAIKVLNVATNILPTAVNPWDIKGEAYFEKKDYENAAKCYKKVLEISPGQGNAISMLNKITESAG